MTIGSLLLSIALATLVILYIGWPFLRPSPSPHAPEQPLVHLQLALDALLTQIRALAFDLETGKIAPDTYQHQRNKLIRDAAVVLRDYDRTVADQQKINADIEAAVTALRAEMRGEEEPHAQ